MIYAYRWGGTRGIFVGVVYGILHFILGFKSSVHYLSIVLDYLVAYGAIGVCGYFKDSLSGLITGSIVGIVLRWGHLLRAVLWSLLAMLRKGRILGFIP